MGKPDLQKCFAGFNGHVTALAIGCEGVIREFARERILGRSCHVTRSSSSAPRITECPELWNAAPNTTV